MMARIKLGHVMTLFQVNGSNVFRKKRSPIQSDLFLWLLTELCCHSLRVTLSKNACHDLFLGEHTNWRLDC